MILLRRWQRYLRYLAAVVCIIVLITVIKQADLDDDADYDEYYEYKSSGRRGAARLQKLTGHGESGSGEDLAWLPGLKKHGGGKVLPVVVVEEHYEVLHYWFQAAEIGLIPKSGNILVHFDAHADVDMPETSSILPRFHYPKSRKEVKSLMQSSEKFIMAAVQSGLLNHIVWVMPSWSRDRTSPSSANIWFKLGTLMRRAPGDHKQNFCSCWVHVSFTADDKDQDRWLGYNFPSEDHNGWRCQTNEFSPLSEEDSGSEINPAQCSVHTLGLLQLVDSAEAADLLTSLSTEQQHLKDKRKILLDIDEDYFGVSSDSFDLSTIGLTLDETDILSDLIGDVFCADTTFDERVADMFHAALLNLLVNIKLQSCELKGESFSVNQRRRKCYTSLQMSNLLIEKIPRMVKFLVEVGEAEHILCSRSQSSWDSSLHTLLQNLILYLQNLSVQQLRHLAWLGICFDVSPSSMYFHQPLPLKLCRGHNNLNKTLVSSFHPSEEELETASEDLKRLLLSFKDRPSLVTLSRSIRDGCTPKELFHNIEGKVLEDLKSVFKGSLHGESIHFDSNLLGGKLGWPRRFPSWNNKLLKFLSVDVVADHYSGT